MTDEELISTFKPSMPTSKLIWTAIVEIGESQDLGTGPFGHRYMVPIIGGDFYAGPTVNGLNGKVLKGGADRQIVRSDGIKELDALYEMQAVNGDVITIRNRVIVDEDRNAEGGIYDRYAMSVINVSAPKGPHDWLNRRLLIGTLQSAKPERQAVIIRAWEIG